MVRYLPLSFNMVGDKTRRSIYLVARSLAWISRSTYFIFTRNRFPLTPLAYLLILIHCCVLFVGAHYTYAEVPLFDTIADWMGSERNNYDKVGHFAQGFIPAMLAREIMLRNQAVKPGAWCAFLATCFVLAFSAFYELIEWWVAVATGEGLKPF